MSVWASKCLKTACSLKWFHENLCCQTVISMRPHVKFVGAKVKWKCYFSLLSKLKDKWYLWCFEWWWVGICRIFLDAYFFCGRIVTKPWSPEVSARFVMFMPLIQKFCFLAWFSLKYKLMLETPTESLVLSQIIQWVPGHPSCPCILILQGLPILYLLQP